MTRGLGEMQKNERMLTNYKIIAALYIQPYTYQQLWIETKIHRNTLRQRLDQLVKDGIIIKQHYNFPNRDFYLLNWAKKQSREIIGCVFGNKHLKGSISFILDPSISTTRTSYEINSIHVKSNRKRYPLIGRKITTVRRPYNRLVCYPYYYDLSLEEVQKKIEGLCITEKDIFEQIRSGIDTADPNGIRAELGRNDKLELIKKRDSILESLVALCTLSHASMKSYRLVNDKFFFINLLNVSFLNLLIFFTTITTIRVYDYSRPYVKFWEIIERSPKLIMG
jgi:DNA-binding Lrp family transcriptional regulator